MKKDVLIKFLDKVIKIRLANGYFYQGKLIKVNDEYVILDDRFDGETIIDISEINTIKEVKDGH